MVDTQKAVLDSTVSDDKISKTKTLYDVSPFEIFWRNFLAGIARALGSFVFYIIFLTILGSLAVKLVLPQIMPVINKFINIGESLNQFQNIKIPQQLPF